MFYLNCCFGIFLLWGLGMASLASCEPRLGSLQFNDRTFDWAVEEISIHDPASYMLLVSEANITGQHLDAKHSRAYALPPSGRMLDLHSTKGTIVSTSKAQAEYSSLNVPAFQESAQAKSISRGCVAHFLKSQTQGRGCSSAMNTLVRIAFAAMTVVLGATVSALL